SNLFLRRDHFGCTRHDDLAILVDALGLEQHLAFGRILFLRRDLDGNGVADLDRTAETQVLAEIDRPGPRKVGSEYRRDESATPHAVADDLPEAAVRRVFRVDMCRI